MSQIKTEHAGYEIVYSENGDLWRCWNLEVEAKTLSALKTKINQCLAEARRVDNVRVWKLDWSGGPKLYAVTLLDGEAHAWVSPVDSLDRKGKTRERADFDKLILDTPENRAAIEAWRALERASRAAAIAASEARDAIPRVTVEALKATRR